MRPNPDNMDARDVLPVLQSMQQTRMFYDRIAPYYDLLSERAERPVRRRALAELDARPGERVLEIGVGTGHSLAALARAVGPAGKAFGVDLSAHMLDQARRHLRRRQLLDRAQLGQADATALPFADEAFDGLLMTFTLELFDVPQIPRVLAECRRMLRPDGRIVIASLTKDADARYVVRALEWAHTHVPQVLDCRPIHVKQAIAAAGFAVTTTATVQVWVPVEIVVARKQGNGQAVIRRRDQ